MRTHRPRRGSALIIVLAFIVMISIVMLTYLASTQSSLKKSASSAAMAETDLLAEAATTAIIDDLHQEMLAGADSVRTNNIMTVSQPWAMVPGRVLQPSIDRADTNFLNLVKQSVGASNFYPGSSGATYTAKGGAPAAGRKRASAVNTAQSSINGRMLSPLRWNKPMLLTGAGFTVTNQLPDWIMISRKGPVTNGAVLGSYNNKNDPNNYVIGRYAYNIYDVGGLLDINVAGYPAGASSDALRKGSLAWADLSAIPGVTDMAKIARWRNTNTTLHYRDMVEGRPLGVTNVFTNSPWGEPGGFLKPYATTSVSDNHFFTRQDLIKFTQSYVDSGLNTNALPFLTTFSADTEQPSFVPLPTRSTVTLTATSGGNDAKGSEDAINPNFLYGTDGLPPVKKRFPLERLKYVNANPTPDDQTKALRYFGLNRQIDGSWNYPGASIRRLVDLGPTEQPNFIEILKAAISVGSLGGQYQLDVSPADSPHRYQSPTGTKNRDGSIDNHIVQIAANIIDQYDADSLPTRINFSGRTFSGVEDLPYLFAIRNTAYRTGLVAPGDLTVAPAKDSSGNSFYPYRCALLLQPTIWNPHATGTVTTTRPTQFRVVAEGDIRVQAAGDWWSNSATPPATPAPGSRFYTGEIGVPGTFPYPSNNPDDKKPQAQFDPNVDMVSFQAATDAFREPYTITSRDYPAGSSSDSNTHIQIQEDKFNQDSGENKNEAIGFMVGYLWAGPVVDKNGTNPPERSYFDSGRTVGNGIDFSLQYLHPNTGVWITYDMMESVPPHLNIFQNNSAGDSRRPRAWARLDPRSDRFGYRDFLFFVTGNINSASVWPQGMTYRRLTDGSDGMTGFGDTLPAWWAVSARPSPWGTASDNKANSGVRYNDPDGVRRLAMGGTSVGSAGLPAVTGNFGSRPIMLNRPFRSVAELGYASRGMPWKQLDFWTPESGDAALLDMFCLYEPSDESADPVVAGRINLNTRRSEVLQALLRGVALKAENPASVAISAGEAKDIADRLVGWTTNQALGPLQNRSELVGRGISGTNYQGFSTNFPAVLASAESKAISFQRQSVMRALVDVGTTRTWTFLIDLIVQKGRYPANAASLDKFMVEGEQRFWVQIAVDRYSGKVIAKQVEAVNE